MGIVNYIRSIFETKSNKLSDNGTFVVTEATGKKEIALSKKPGNVFVFYRRDEDDPVNNDKIRYEIREVPSGPPQYFLIIKWEASFERTIVWAAHYYD